MPITTPLLRPNRRANLLAMLKSRDYTDFVPRTVLALFANARSSDLGSSPMTAENATEVDDLLEDDGPSFPAYGRLSFHCDPSDNNTDEEQSTRSGRSSSSCSLNGLHSFEQGEEPDGGNKHVEGRDRTIITTKQEVNMMSCTCRIPHCRPHC